MPQLINYLSRLTPARFYDEAELTRLQHVYDRARQALEIDANDPRRETLAMLIFETADQIQEPEKLFQAVVSMFQRRGYPLRG